MSEEVNDLISWSALSGFRAECGSKFGSIFDLRIISGPYSLLDSYLKPDSVVLDVGAGIDKPLLKTLQNRQYQGYFALEPDPNGEADYGSVSDIPESQTFDLAWSNQVLEHVPLNDCMMLVKGIFNHLNSGGVYISTVPNVAHPVRYWADATHVTHWPIGDYYGLFRMNGFEVVDYVRYSKKRLPRNPLKYFVAKVVSETFRMDWCDSLAIVVRKP